MPEIINPKQPKGWAVAVPLKLRKGQPTHELVWTSVRETRKATIVHYVRTHCVVLLN